MKKALRFLVTFASCIFLTSLSACNKSDQTSRAPELPDKEQNAELPEVKLTVESGSATIGINKSIKIIASKENTEEKITFSSDAPAIASVNENGVVTGLETGFAIITVSVAGKSREIEITVADYTSDSQAREINIYCEEGLINFAETVNLGMLNAVDYTINILSDIDLNGAEWTPLAGYSLAKSTFNGNGHTIGNFIITNEAEGPIVEGQKIRYTAFIGGSYGITVKNITFSDVSIDNPENAYCGLVVGYLEGTGTFENVTVKNSEMKSLNSKRGAGALVGYAHNKANDKGERYLTIRKCVIENVRISSKRAAGLVARMEDKSVINSIPSGDQWRANIEKNKVTGCTFRCDFRFADGNMAMHWATTLPNASIGVSADNSGNDFAGNSYYFEETEYLYASGMFTKKK